MAVPAPWRSFDAVLTATALHWLPAPRVAGLYVEVRALLQPGGVLGNADHMPDGGRPGLGLRLDTLAAERAARHRKAGAWHVAALRDAGFSDAFIVWRGGEDALVVGVAGRAIPLGRRAAQAAPKPIGRW